MSRFDYFVVFAEMRTGSNFLESNLNKLEGVLCHGEAFNPAFVGAPNNASVLGVSYQERIADPFSLLAKIKAGGDSFHGFRFFHDHEPRILDEIINDPRCAKVILTRNPLESYVSFKIARATGQWRLTNAVDARKQRIVFDGAEFESHVAKLQAFQLRLLGQLQKTGQTAFYVDYEDLQDVDVINGISAYFGRKSRLEKLDQTLKRQNPETLEEKVANIEDIGDAMARLDRFNLARTPNFEPRRPPPVPDFVATTRGNLLFMPIPGASNESIQNWMHRFDGELPLRRDFSARSLEDWKLNHPGHRGFSVLSHPLQRAHAAFCRHILPEHGGGYGRIREHLARHFGMPLPPEGQNYHLDDESHLAAFELFLVFLQANLANQTAVRIDASWASQTSYMQGFAELAVPDLIIREESATLDLALLSMMVGVEDPPEFEPRPEAHLYRLARIATPALQELAFKAYTRDFVGFGFEDWLPPAYLR